MEPDIAQMVELIDAKVDEIKAMLIELLQWKSELETAMVEMKSGGLLQVFSNMFGANK